MPSLPNEILINFGTIKRHGGGVIDIRVVLKTVVRARAIPLHHSPSKPGSVPYLARLWTWSLSC